MDYIMLIYPIALFVIMCYKAKFAGKGKFYEDCWSGTDSKNLQMVMAFGIMLHHLTQGVSNYGNVYRGPITVMSDMGILFTTVFFFYSGFGLMRSLKTKTDYLQNFLRKRFPIILVPFMVTNILYIAKGLADGRIHNVLGFFTSIFGFTLINTNAWFVVELLIFYLAFYVAFKKIKKERNAIAAISVVVLAVIAIGFFLRHDNSSINGHWFMGEWWFNTSIMFVVGLIAGAKRDELAGFFKRKYIAKLVIGVILLAGFAVLENIVRHEFGYYHETYRSINYVDRLITLAAQTLLILAFMLVVLMVTMKIRFDNIVLRKGSLIIFELYLVQDFCMDRESYLSEMPGFMIFGFAIATSIILAVLLYYAEKFIFMVYEKSKKANMDEYMGESDYAEKVRFKSWVKMTKIAYLILFVGLVICFSIYLVDITFIAKNELDENLQTIKTAQIGDVVHYGHLNTDPMESGDEPIEWIVVNRDSNKVMLLSKEILDTSYYSQKHRITSYEDSDIRKYLSNEGTFEIFSGKEREHMMEHPVAKDLVFLITLDEIADDKKLDGVLNADYTKILKRYGAGDNSWWWLRGEDIDIYAPSIDKNGLPAEKPKEVNRASGGIRPAIIVEAVD